MPVTPGYNFPYPALTDDPNVPDDMNQLALAVEAEIQRVETNVSSVLAAAQNISTALVATGEGTGSATYVNLATPGPAVTLTTGSMAIVWFYATMWQDTATQAECVAMSIAVSGATTIAASDAIALTEKNVSSAELARHLGTFAIFTTLTPGSNTFTAVYRSTDLVNNANFSNRRIAVYAPQATLLS